MARVGSAALALFGACGVLGWWNTLPALVLLAAFVWLPGVSLLCLLREKPGGSPGDSALACCVSLALLVPCVAPLFFVGVGLGTAAFTLGPVYILCGIAACMRAPSGDAASESTGTASVGCRWAAACAAAAVLLPLVLEHAGGTIDDWWDLAFVRGYADAPVLSFAEPMLESGAAHPRFLWNSWLIAQALTAHFSGMDPVSLQQAYLGPLVCLMSVAAVDYFAAGLLPRSLRAGVIAPVLFFPILMFGTEQLPYFTRLHQDKFVAALVCMPVLVGALLRSLDRRTPISLAVAAAAALAACGVHSLVYSITLAGCWAVVGARVGTAGAPTARTAAASLAAVSWPFAYPMFQSWWVSSRFARQAISLDNPDSPVVRAHLALDRLLWPDSPAYIVDPSAVFSVVALLGLPGLIFAFRRREQPWARSLLALALLPLALIFVPFVAATVGSVIVPWMLYRVGWLVPAALLGGLSFVWAAQVTRSGLRWCTLALLAIVAVALAVPTVSARASRDMHRRPFEKPQHPQGTTLDVYTYLRDSREEGVVMSPPAFSELVSAMSGRAVVAMGERGSLVFSTDEAGAYRRLRARAEFYLDATPLRRRMELARQYGVVSVVVRRNPVPRGEEDRWLRRFGAEGWLLAGRASNGRGEELIAQLHAEGWRVVHDNRDFAVLEPVATEVRALVRRGDDRNPGQDVQRTDSTEDWLSAFPPAETGSEPQGDVLASMTGYPGAIVEVAPAPFTIGVADEPIWGAASASWDDAPFEVEVAMGLGRECEALSLVVVPFMKFHGRQVLSVHVDGRETAVRAVDGVPIVIDLDRRSRDRVAVRVASLLGAAFGLADLRVLGDRSTCTGPPPRRSGFADLTRRLATADYLDLSMMFPRNSRADLGLARSIWERGGRGDALELMEQALVDDPGLANSWIEAGLMHDRVGNRTAARRHYERALALDPFNAWARGCMAWSRVRDGRAVTGLYHARLASRYDERYADAFTIAGMAEAALGWPGRALDSFTHAIHLDPGRSWAYTEMAELLAGQGKAEMARTVLQDYLDLEPEDEAVTRKLAALGEGTRRDIEEN